jgi:hypothetical protein
LAGRPELWYCNHVTRTELHRIVDELPEASVDVAGALLRRAADEPEVARLLAAPLDDEPYTAEERAEDARALAAIEQGEGVDWPEAKTRLGSGR